VLELGFTVAVNVTTVPSGTAVFDPELVVRTSVVVVTTLLCAGATMLVASRRVAAKLAA